MGAALGAGHRVHLVDDDRLDAAQGLARLRGEQQEQRLRRGDEDVGRLGAGSAGARRPGCRRSGSRRRCRARAGRAGSRRAGCRSAGRAGCARRRRRAPSSGRRRGPGSAAGGPRRRRRRRAGRGTRGTPRASCPSRSGRRRACCCPALIASQAPAGRPWVGEGALEPRPGGGGEATDRRHTMILAPGTDTRRSGRSTGELPFLDREWDRTVFWSFSTHDHGRAGDCAAEVSGS